MAFKEIKKLTTSEKETIDMGSLIYKKLPKDISLIIIKGDLGTGKTTLIRGIAKEMGIKDQITSPSFGVKKNYNGFIHYDLYLSDKTSSKNLYSLISEDIESNIVVVEWGNKLPKISNALFVEIEYVAENQRKIEVKEI